MTAKRSRSRKTQTEDEAWEGVDRDLCEELRRWRRETAEARGWPPFAVFSDHTLRDLARVRPTNLTNLREIHGIGDAKLQSFGAELLAIIVPWCQEKGLTTDQLDRPARQPVAERTFGNAPGLFPAFSARLDDRRSSGRFQPDHRHHRQISLHFHRGRKAREHRSAGCRPTCASASSKPRKPTTRPYLRPTYEALGGQVSYDMIRIVMTHAGLECCHRPRLDLRDPMNS